MNQNVFDPNDIRAKNHNLFGLTCDYETSKIVIIPVPWEVTVSYRHGTSMAPENILKSSVQIDLFHEHFPDFWKDGIVMLPISEIIKQENQVFSQDANEVIHYLENGGKKSDLKIAEKIERINEGCNQQVDWVEATTLQCIEDNKIVGILGGEHSVSEGAIKAFAKHYDSFGILQFDAHMDLRKDYEGFACSHASVMYNVLKIPQVTQLTQVGVRDYCYQELEFANAHENIHVFSDAWIKKQLFLGKSWDSVCSDIVDSLPENIYITLDIDALNPALCPDTGTPVPGGLQFEEIFYLLSKIVQKKKTIIGFDLVEVAGEADTINTIIGARALYSLCGYTSKSYFK